MIQHTRQWRSGHSEMAWLSALVDTMHEVARPELRATACDASLRTALRAQLASAPIRPGHYGSEFSFRN